MGSAFGGAAQAEADGREDAGAVAVNVSARRLVTGDLADTLAAAIQQTMVDPERLEIEITETVAIRYETDSVEAIRRVRALGVRVAIDDFGMGHSALSRLQSFPVDRPKDRSILRESPDRGRRAGLDRRRDDRACPCTTAPATSKARSALPAAPPSPWAQRTPRS